VNMVQETPKRLVWTMLRYLSSVLFWNCYGPRTSFL